MFTISKSIFLRKSQAKPPKYRLRTSLQKKFKIWALEFILKNGATLIKMLIVSTFWISSNELFNGQLCSQKYVSLSMLFQKKNYVLFLKSELFETTHNYYEHYKLFLKSGRYAFGIKNLRIKYIFLYHPLNSQISALK